MVLQGCQNSEQTVLHIQLLLLKGLVLSGVLWNLIARIVSALMYRDLSGIPN